MQYHQLRILCALRDKIAEKNDKSLTGHQAMDRARARMTRLGSGSRDLFDLKIRLHPRGRKRDSGCGSF
jgi:hypothetical protein